MYKHVYQLSSFSNPNVISGFVGSTGALSYYDPFHQTYLWKTIENTQFLSYCIPSGHSSSFYAIDENYAGSSLYEFENTDATIKLLKKTYNKDILGGVFVLQHDSLLYVPGFGSHNLWIINESSFTTVNTVETGFHPHGIFFYQDIFYVPCRGDINNNANSIYRYKNNDLSNSLDTIDLSSIKDNSGPRHLAFMRNFIYVITEFSCQIIRLALHDFSDYKTTTMISPVTMDTTGAEIVYYKSCIYTTLRIKNQQGHFIRYDTDLNETGRLKVGINPRFFNITEQDYAIILNQDDQSFTVVDINDWKIVTTITNLQVSPQCFVF